jgi:hypothetical protein
MKDDANRTFEYFYIYGNDAIVVKGGDVNYGGYKGNGANPLPYSRNEFENCINGKGSGEIYMNSLIGSKGKYTLNSITGGNKMKRIHTIYYECNFNSDGSISFQKFHGFGSDDGNDIRTANKSLLKVCEDSSNRTCDVSPELGGVTHSPISDILSDVPGFVTYKNLSEFLSVIRNSQDQLMNKCQMISTQISIYNQDIQQNFNVATSIVTNSEEAQKKTVRNIHS